MVNISGDGFRVAEPAARGAIEFSASAVNSEQQQNPSVAMLGATATRDASGRTAEMRGPWWRGENPGFEGISVDGIFSGIL